MSAGVRRRVAPREWSWIGLEDRLAWDDAAHAVDADVFHRAWFHALARSRGEGTPRLFVFRSDDAVVVLPLLLRTIEGSDDRDATSVYGYVGPVSRGNATQADVAAFQAGLRASLASQGVVSVFSRLHPLRDESRWLRGLGSIERGGTTVSIGLQRGADARRAAYRGSHRREIARLRREGYRVHGDDGAIDAFHQVYTSAMLRLGAGSRYAFGPEQLRAMIVEGGMRLFVVRKDEDVAAAGLFSLTDTGSHYFLSGTDPRHRKLAPSKLMIDAACDWARAEGAPWLHLGGGVGGAEDALFRFKAGFGPARHEFHTWRWVVDAHAYRSHCERAGVPEVDGFFPAYRG